MRAFSYSLFIGLGVFCPLPSHARVNLPSSSHPNPADTFNVTEEFAPARPGTGNAQCLKPPPASGRFAVDTDGGANANGSKTYQSGQSYQSLWGGTIDPSRALGAVNLDGTNGLRGGDIICYKIKSNPSSTPVCGVNFDNAFAKMGQSVVGVKPEEATAALHRALGASRADGSGSSLGNTAVQSYPIRLSDSDRNEVIQAFRTARETNNYNAANNLLQQKAAEAGCAGRVAAQISPSNSQQDFFSSAPSSTPFYPSSFPQSFNSTPTDQIGNGTDSSASSNDPTGLGGLGSFGGGMPSSSSAASPASSASPIDFSGEDFSAPEIPIEIPEIDLSRIGANPANRNLSEGKSVLNANPSSSPATLGFNAEAQVDDQIGSPSNGVEESSSLNPNDPIKDQAVDISNKTEALAASKDVPAETMPEINLDPATANNPNGTSTDQAVPIIPAAPETPAVAKPTTESNSSSALVSIKTIANQSSADTTTAQEPAAASSQELPSGDRSVSLQQPAL